MDLCIGTLKMKTYSATQFFNELDLLEIRFETLNDCVDYFVVSESTKTHSGLAKPLYYLENKDRYKKFHHKIIHQIIDDTPSNIGEILSMKAKNKLHEKAIGNVLFADWFDKSIESYLRDTYEKEMLLFALGNCNSEDIILLGDLDEIPRPNKLDGLNHLFKKEETYNFQHDMFYYYFNNQKTNEPWLGTIAISFDNLLKNSFCELRTHKRGNAISDGGWHFTYMGGADKIKTKVESWGEQSLNTDFIKDNIEKSLQDGIVQGYDLFFRPSNFLKRDINDGTFPDYIVRNQEKFAKYIRQ